ncbi:DgyrCDS226 [Dimorphilus gyrociliatus]|uniref:DgyrCDS226 n=1 Tax=Dimorphilus gyrociliatus TaxID=2664684 RepID=A0A7I8V5F7_9ANNE|nr:DgyrCDS226 [Dimorphilus gyrociliatus]
MASNEDSLINEIKRSREIVKSYDSGSFADIDESEVFDSSYYNKIDRFGFRHPEGYSETSDESKTKKKDISRLQKWDKYVKAKAGFRKDEKFRKRVYKGVPQRFRGWYWESMLDVKNTKDQQIHGNVYKNMTEKGRNYSPYIDQIDKDVNRTFRSHTSFEKRYQGQQKHLFNVLVAYSVYNTEIGYTQGMNGIAALLCMFLSDEDAFWAFSNLFTVEKYGMHGFFALGFPKIERFKELLQSLLKKHLKKLYKHMKEMNIVADTYVFKFFMACFAHCVPPSLMFRLFDVFILEGDKMLLAMGLLYFKKHSKKMLKMNDEKLYEYMNNTLPQNFGYPDDEVMTELMDLVDELQRSRTFINKLTQPDGKKECPNRFFMCNTEEIQKRIDCFEKMCIESLPNPSYLRIEEKKSPTKSQKSGTDENSATRNSKSSREMSPLQGQHSIDSADELSFSERSYIPQSQQAVQIVRSNSQPKTASPKKSPTKPAINHTVQVEIESQPVKVEKTNLNGSSVSDTDKKLARPASMYTNITSSADETNVRSSHSVNSFRNSVPSSPLNNGLLSTSHKSLND